VARPNQQRLEAARRVYREALEAARADPTPKAWARLLAAGKDLSAAEEPRRGPPRRRRRRESVWPPGLEGPADFEGLE